MKDIDIEKRAQAAMANFKNGCNCSQSVLTAFGDLLNMSEDELMRLGSPFGGGIAGTRHVCGAVNAMLMINGMLDGYTKTEGDKKTHYSECRELMDKFAAQTGSIICKELLGIRADLAKDPAPRTPDYYAARSCHEYCYTAAKLIAEKLSKEG